MLITMSSSVRHDRRKLLFLTPWPPTGSGSGGQFVSGMLLRLYAEEFDVTIVAGYGTGFGRPTDFKGPGTVREWVPLRLQHLAHPVYGAATAIWAWARRRSYRAQKMLTRQMKRAVARALACESYDLIHVDMELMTGVVPPTDVPIIVSAQNVEPEIFKRMARHSRNALMRCAARLEASRSAITERAATRRAAGVIAMSDRDARVLRRLHKLDATRTVAVYPAVQPIERQSVSEKPGVLLLGSLASPGRLEGVKWFLETVWHGIRSVCPNAELNIVGSEPPAWLRSQDGTDGLRVHGFVTDLNPVLRSTRVVAVPLRVGGGIRVKVVEMMARGIPIVATTVASTGLREQTLRTIRLANTPHDFATAVSELLTDNAAWERQAAAQWAHARQDYSLDTARHSLRSLLAAAARGIP